MPIRVKKVYQILLNRIAVFQWISILPREKKVPTYQTTFSIKRLWLILSVGMVVMFGILLLLGREIYHQAPPTPERVVSASGETLFTRDDIETGQIDSCFLT